jgi:metal-sulfur cluster biosynthetic enzyme
VVYAQTRMADTANPATDAPETTAGSGADAASTTATAAEPLFDAERRATELAILDALRAVVDPEIGMNVVELALIKQILLGRDETEIKMILTTPFCPYAGSMIAQVKEQVESVVDHPVKVTLLAERWDPRDAGLMW